MKITIQGAPKEIAALVVALQERQILKQLSPKELLYGIFGEGLNVNPDLFAQSIFEQDRKEETQ